MPVVFANPLQPLIDVCEQVLLFFHDNTGVGWGMSIILLTVTVRLVLLPLTLKQVTSMQRLQVLAPEMKKIQEKYKDDKQRQQQEMMKFYRENKVNPLASCLPLLFQLPFFIALYYMLQGDLKRDMCAGIAKFASVQNTDVGNVTCSQFGDYVSSHPVQAAAQGLPRVVQDPSFLFIPDLTAKATGSVLIVLVVLYVASQLGSGLLSSASMDKNQRMLMLALPIVFVFFIINFPAGLMVYWITTNVWTIVQQLIVRKTVGVVKPAGAGGAPVPAGAAAVTGGGSGKAGKTSKKSPARGGSANGGSASPAGPPPGSPRKKKKRTGRRR